MWKRLNYLAEAARQLSDPAVYVELSRGEAFELYEASRRRTAELGDTLNEEGHITRPELDRLVRHVPRMPAVVFYPKIHQSPHPSTGTWRGRAVIAADNGPLKMLDVYISKWCSFLLPHLTDSVQNTAELIRSLEELSPLPSEAILFSVDVVSLYPSVPIEEGINLASWFYFERREKLVKIAKQKNLLPPPSAAMFKKILKAILTSNVFHFREERWFKQIKGVAMGSSISLFVASVYMYERSRNAGIARSPLPAQLLYLRRYIDDFVGIILGGGLPEVQALFSQVENEHIRLTFVVPPRGESLEALDLRLSIVDGRVVTKLYRKPTDGTRRFVH